MACTLCGKELTKDEKAIYKRLVDRGADDSQLECRVCLAKELGVPVERIDEKIEHFKSIGCTLFM